MGLEIIAAENETNLTGAEIVEFNLNIIFKVLKWSEGF